MEATATVETIESRPGVPVFKRWVIFNAVGGLGILLQLGLLGTLAGPLNWNYLAATAAAVEVTVLHNFVWHERWTWAERAGGGTASMLGRLARFHLTNGIFSLLGNLLLMRFFVGTLAMSSIKANLLSIAICSILNFLAGDRLVFPAAEPGRGIGRRCKGGAQ